MYRWSSCLSNKRNTLTLVQSAYLETISENIYPSFPMYIEEKKGGERNTIIILPGCTNRTSKILSTWLLYAVIWKIHSGESWMHVIFTGTKSSETCCHFTVPAPLALTWNTSAHSLEILIAELCVVINMINRISKKWYRRGRLLERKIRT